MVVKKTVILLFISYGGCPERNAAWGGLDELAQKSPNNLWRTNPIFFVFCLLLLGSTFQLPIIHLCFINFFLWTGSLGSSFPFFSFIYFILIQDMCG